MTYLPKNRSFKQFFIMIFMLISKIISISVISEEQCNVIGAPDSENGTRSCTYIANTLEETVIGKTCMPSQSWLNENFENSLAADIIKLCTNSDVDNCPMEDFVENIFSCSLDADQKDCITQPLLVLFELLHGLVNTYPQLKSAVLDTPKDCSELTRNISCLRNEACFWSPFENQFSNGDIIISDNITNEFETILETQKVNVIVPNQIENRTNFTRSLELKVGLFEANFNTISLLITRASSFDDSVMFQLAYENLTTSQTFSFNTEPDELSQAMRDLVSVNVLIKKTVVNFNTALFEFTFDAVTEADVFNIPTILSSNGNDINVLKVRHEINKQSVTITGFVEEEDFEVILSFYGSNEIVSMAITKATTPIDIETWLLSIEDIPFAKVIGIQSIDATNSIVYEIAFISLSSSTSTSSDIEGTYLPLEYLLHAEPTEGVTAIVDYLVMHALPNPTSAIMFSACKFTDKLSGLVDLSLLQNDDTNLTFSGFNTNNLNLPLLGDLISILGNVYTVENILVFVEVNTNETLKKIYEVTLNKPIFLEANIGPEFLEKIEVFRCEVNKKVYAPYNGESVDFVSSFNDLFDSLDLIVEVESSNTDNIRTFSAVFETDIFTSYINTEVVNCPYNMLNVNGTENICNDVFATNPYEKVISYSTDLTTDSVGNEFVIAFSGYLNDNATSLKSKSDRKFILSDDDTVLIRRSKCIFRETFRQFREGDTISCNEVLFQNIDIVSTPMTCFSEPISTTDSSAVIFLKIQGICNLGSVSVVTNLVESDARLSIEIDIVFQKVLPSQLFQPFALYTTEAANVPPLFVTSFEALESEAIFSLVTTTQQGNGALLSSTEPLPHESFVGDLKDAPCIVNLNNRNQVGFVNLGITNTEEIESITELDRHMYTCAGRKYEAFEQRQLQSIVSSPTQDEDETEPITREACLSINVGLDQLETDDICVWRGNVSKENQFSWSNLSYFGVSAEVIHSPCTSTMTSKTRQLLRVYRLFKDQDDVETFPGYDNVLGSRIKSRINDFLNKDGGCRTPEDIPELTTLFTRAWQLIITHCLYVTSVVYTFAGVRIVYILDKAKNQPWELGKKSVRRALINCALVFSYMFSGVIYVFLLSCIPAAVLAKFIGSNDSIGENTLTSLGQGAAVILLYIDLGSFIKEF